ncbi:MAG TPA: DUF2147 domain-containing protein [Rhodopila sp.]
MMLRFLFFALMVLLPVRLSAAVPSAVGYWLTQGRDGVIAITPCGTALCAYIAGVFLDHPTDPTPVDNRGVSQCGLPLITDAREIRPGLWKGHIINPRNGDVWGVEFHLDSRGNLALRGFIGVPLLGRTQTWTRYPGRPPADCRIIATTPAAGG